MNNTSVALPIQRNTSGPSVIVPSKLEGIAWCSAFLLAFVFAVVGNLLTIAHFAVNKGLRKKCMFLVVNMAFADLMLAFLALPIRVYFVGVLSQLWMVELLWNKSFFVFYTVVDTVFSQASLISAVFISCERFYAIYWPFKHRTLSMQAYRIVIVITWTLAVLITAVVTGFNHFVSSMTDATYAWTPYVFTLTILIWSCNIAIWRKFQQSSVASQQQNRVAQNKRLTKTLLFVSFFALLCWLPLVIRNNLLAHRVRITQNIINLVSLIYYSNTIVNPIVYSLRIPELKQALALCCSRKQTEIIVKGKEGRIKLAAAMDLALLAVSPATQLSLQDDASHELAFEEEIMDTKL